MILNMSSLAFGATASQDKESLALQELLEFLEHPHSVGLDNVKESLRNVVQYMMELKGYSTGYSLQILVLGEHSSMAANGILRYDAKKKQEIEDFWRELLALNRLLSTNFYSIQQNAVTYITEIKEDIIEEIAAIDAAIVAKANNATQAQEMKNNNSKRKKLISFKNNIEEQKEDLLDADNSKEVLEIHKNVIEDVQDLKAGQFNPNKPHQNPLGLLGNVLTQTQAQNDANYNIIDEFKTSTDITNSNSETRDSSSGKQGDNTAPPPPIIEV